MRQGPGTGFLGQGDQRRPGKGAEVLRQILGVAFRVIKFRKRVTRFDKRVWYKKHLRSAR